MKIFFSLLILVLLYSCSAERGNRVIGGELSVYFDSKEDEKKAEDIALYWKENGFITGERQDIKIVSKLDKYQLLLIENDNMNMGNLPFKERKLLNDLKNDLQKKIFNKPLEILICNEKFEPKYVIN